MEITKTINDYRFNLSFQFFFRVGFHNKSKDIYGFWSVANECQTHGITVNVNLFWIENIKLYLFLGFEVYKYNMYQKILKTKN